MIYLGISCNDITEPIGAASTERRCCSPNSIECKKHDVPLANPKAGLNEELKFTLEKIIENFSNYSAFHCRSSLMKHMIDEVYENREKNEKDNENNILNIRSMLERETEVVENAIFTEPDDQSPWWYLRFLIQCSLSVYQKIVNNDSSNDNTNDNDNNNNNNSSNNHVVVRTDVGTSFRVWLEYLLSKLVISIEQLLEEEGGLMSDDGGRWCKMALVDLYTSRYTLLYSNSDYGRRQVLLDALTHTDPIHKVRYQYLLQSNSSF